MGKTQLSLQKQKTDKIVPVPTASKINRHRRGLPMGLFYQFCYLSWPISQRTLSQSGSTSTNHDKTKMSLYGNTATFFGAADRIRTCGLSGRSRTIYPAELQPHIYENRRWDEIHRIKFCENLERKVHGGHFVVRPPGKSARHRIFKRNVAKNRRTTPPRHSCRRPVLHPAEL